jgi:DNA polymerase elongation subunit (family B)
MSKSKTKVSNEQIESFLQGSNPEKYIVAVESNYNEPKVTLVINDPEKGKYLYDDTYKPFLWFKEDVTSMIYGGKRLKIMEACKDYGIKITKLITSNEEGYTPDRMDSGYKYMATCKHSYNNLLKFFKEGGVDVFSDKNIDPDDDKSPMYRSFFVMFSPTEQYLIQSGKRLFNGMDDYDDVHRFQFDLETEGLFASKHAIFQIGVRDNKGLEGVLETIGATPSDKRNSERENIEKFFKIIDAVQPDIITGYNSENFDWPFLFERAERLSIPITELAITLNRISKIRRKDASLKLGGETEKYKQTHMYGYNIMDISHAVRRAMAINSEIKSWGLKYITQYSEIAKPNRVYVPGDKINTTWADKVNQYAFNDTDGDWYIITDKKPLKDNYKVVKGDYIVQRYLCDDLWETEQIDNIFNQASFLIAKMLPTTFMRSSTMGTAGQWKLIMAAWSYERGLAIPSGLPKRDFTGGLSRLLEVGYARGVVKLDFAALYPKIQLTHLIFPDLDISGVMEGMLTYVVDTRDKFKFLTGIEKKKAKKLEAKLKENKDLTAEVIVSTKKEIGEYKALANLYDKKQLPLKILANSWFGSYGAPYIFNWGDTDSAEETTCRGRQYLRLMVRHFTEKHGFRALVGDTDGFNFAFPDNIDEIKYVAKGSHWKTTDDGGKELTGLDAVLAEFNENYMEGRMGLDIDDICNSTINFARKNYANDIGGKIKLVGNSVKSKKMSVYIEEFLGKGIRMLLDGDGYSFVNHYYEYVDKIYNYQIPLVKMASKAKIKITIAEYKKKATKTNIAGNPLPKQAHMELVMREGLDVNLGDTLFYINIGASKSTGDLKTIDKNKMSKKDTYAYFEANGCYPTVDKVVELNCKLIDPETVEKDFENIKELEVLKKALIAMEENGEMDTMNEAYVGMTDRMKEIQNSLYTDEYNVARYLDAFNKKVKPLLVCFNEDVRSKIVLDIVKTKDKITKKTTEKLKERTIFTKGECELVSGIPFKESDQDTYADLMRMEDKEIKFWDKVNKIPNNMEVEEWDEIRADYHERLRIARLEGIQHEKDTLEDIFKHLEIKELNAIKTTGELQQDVFIICGISNDGDGMLISRKWNEPLCHVSDIFKYEKDAIERDKYYQMAKNTSDDRYEQWLDYVTECTVMTGQTYNIFSEIEEGLTEHETEVVIETIDNVTEKLIKKAESIIIVKPTEVKKKRVYSESEEDEDVIEEDENGNLVRSEENINLDDEYDDTFGEMPDDYESRSPEETDEYWKNQRATMNEAIESINTYNKNVKKIEEEEKKDKPEDEWGF